MDTSGTTAMQYVTDQDTARRALTKFSKDLAAATEHATQLTNKLRDLIVKTRPEGLLTVDEMAQAIGRDRNYVDAVWSAYGHVVKGKQTRVPVTDSASPKRARNMYEQLADTANSHRNALAAQTAARTERDRVVAMVYASKLLGPSAIATAVEIDRNHVLRIARKAGIAPVHRTGSKNQHTAK